VLLGEGLLRLETRKQSSAQGEAWEWKVSSCSCTTGSQQGFLRQFVEAFLAVTRTGAGLKAKGQEALKSEHCPSPK
jgi:hypothetical protein